MRPGTLLALLLFVALQGSVPALAEPGALSGWRWTGSQLKAAPDNTPMHNLWNKLCELYACMPAELVAAAGVQKEDVTVFNPSDPAADRSWGKKSSTTKSGGKAQIKFTLDDLVGWNVYLSKWIVHEELWHATQQDVYKPPSITEGTPSEDQVELFLTNDGYAEVEARLEAAKFVGPMTGKVTSDGPLTDELAKTQLDEKGKVSVERALKQMCTSYDKIKNATFDGAEKKAKDVFKKCKEAGQAYVS